MEIRVHGRGGQGGVTCAKLLASVYAKLGKSVQTFGDYAGERSGAPVRAYTRVSDEPITNRNKVYEPDPLLVLDPTLLGDAVVAGLRPGGTLLLNTPESIETIQERFAGFRVATLDATAIARRHRIGTRTVVIVNTTIAGAFVRVMDLSFDTLAEAYRDLGLESNLDAAREAWETVEVREACEGASSGVRSPGIPASAPSAPAAAAPAGKPVLPLVEHRESLPTGLQTGSWRTQQPRYAHFLSPCNAACPAGNDVIGFVRTLAERGEEAAANLLARTNPLAGICGRICPAPCMERCNRNAKDGAVNVRGLERWIADHVQVPRPSPARTDRPRRFAVVGSGAAGLTAAYMLGRGGHTVALFDHEEELGGGLRHRVPAFRLPRDVVASTVDAILGCGVEARRGESIDADRLEELSREFDAVILATGRTVPRGPQIPGEELDGVVQGIDFLRGSEGAAPASVEGPVVVLGGGETAVDCARSAIRRGASSVIVIDGGDGFDRPAPAAMIEEATQEGIEFRFLRWPVAIRGDEGRVQGVEIADVDLRSAASAGAEQPVLAVREETVPCGHVILAAGRAWDASIVPEGWRRHGDRFHREGPEGSNGDPTETNVLLAGDPEEAAPAVADAIGDGRRAAGRALEILGVRVAVFRRPDPATAVPPSDLRLEAFDARPPAAAAVRPAAERRASFAEAHEGLEDACEAHRCLSCGKCTRCDTCLAYCPEGIIRRRGKAYKIDMTYCKGCGICVSVCPHKGMEMVDL